MQSTDEMIKLWDLTLDDGTELKCCDDCKIRIESGLTWEEIRTEREQLQNSQ